MPCLFGIIELTDLSALLLRHLLDLPVDVEELCAPNPRRIRFP
jgi:hypothetical protein